MKLFGNLVAGLAVVIGIVWTLQGANILGGSFMSGRPHWLYIGIGIGLAGVIGFWWLNFRTANDR